MEIEETIKDLKANFEKLLDANARAIAKISEHEPELSKKISSEMAEVVDAIKNNDMSKLTELQKKYADNINK